MQKYAGKLRKHATDMQLYAENMQEIYHYSLSDIDFNMLQPEIMQNICKENAKYAKKNI